jgi:short-subunit dehydrogenase involved in D-alanine esterification of teichoic acids
MRLAGKVAIISGAASGMGMATARMFAREGAKVVIADMLEHEGRQVAEAIGTSARFEPLDVTKEDNWAAVVAATTKHFGKLDVLVNLGIRRSCCRSTGRDACAGIHASPHAIGILWLRAERTSPLGGARG